MIMFDEAGFTEVPSEFKDFLLFINSAEPLSAPIS